MNVFINIDTALANAPVNSVGVYGWMTKESFLDVLHHFRKFANFRKNNRTLLLMDNHSSHTSYEAIKYARENNIILLTFSPHLTHKIQSLDVGMYGNFKKGMQYSKKDFLSAQQNSYGITIDLLPQISKAPFEAVFVPQKIVSARSKAQVYGQ